MKHGNTLQMKVKFEDSVIMDGFHRINDENDFDDITKDLKRKLFGR